MFRSFYIFSLLLCINPISAQTLIKGVLLSEQGDKPFGVSLLVYTEKNSVDILTYDISDQLGKFELSISSHYDSVLVATKSMVFKDTFIWLENKNQEIEIVLQSHIRKIKEVDIRAHPISTRGDTINYVVNSFAKKNDQSIGDVIGNMPGFEVTGLGKIYYQGRPIQKYYIEGLDLLEKRYAIANKNLPHKSVGSVEVLQNHQPIKLLEDKVASDETSINIKLKKNVAITGTLYAGIGTTPFLHDVNLTPMLFHKKQQMIASWQTNNIGDDLNTQHQPLFFSNGKLTGHKNRKQEYVSITAIPKPDIDRKWYLDNNANLLTYNHLLKVNQKTELKINSSYYRDILKEKGSIFTSYFLDGRTFIIEESTQNTYSNKSIFTEFTLTQNHKSHYFTNKINLQGYWDSQSGEMLNQTSLSQKAETPHFTFSNEFDLLFPIQNNFIHVYSFVDLNQSPHRLSFFPGVFPNILNQGQNFNVVAQKYKTSNFLTENYLQFTLRKGKWIYETTSGIIFNTQDLKTSIEKDNILLETDSLNNQLNWKYTETYITEDVQFKNNSFMLSFSIPFRGVFYHIADKFHDTPDKIRKFLVTPSLKFKFDIAKFMTARLSAKYNSSLGEVNDLTQGYIIKSHRLMHRQTNELMNKNSYSYSSRLEYKNPISGFFYTAYWLYKNDTKNLLLKQKFTDTGLLFHEIKKRKNQIINKNLSFKISQYVAKLNTTFSINSFVLTMQKDYILNNQLGKLTLKSFALEPGLSISRWEFIDIGYKYNFQLLQQKTLNANLDIIEQKHKIDLYITPCKRHLIGINLDYYQSKQSEQEPFDLSIANMSYLYKPKRGKLKFKINVHNLLNHTQIVNYYQNDISLTKTSYQIRPRQVIAILLIGL